LEDMVNMWHGRRVFVTGHTGFKGSWLTLWLTKMGARVCGYALDPWTDPNMFTVANVSAAIAEDVRGNTLDREKLEATMTGFAPEVVFHLAAQPLVRRSYADPVGTYATNVMGTVHVLEAIRKTPSVRAVVSITTDKCYENKEWVWPYRETDSLGGFDPYSSSKACAEIISAAYRSSFFPVESLAEHHVAVGTARAGNVIGGGDWSTDRLIPDLIRGFLSRQPVLIRRPKAVRPWQHVLEPLRGYILLAEQLFAQKQQFASAFNFGPGADDVWSVERIATKIVDAWGNGTKWVLDDNPSVHEDRYLNLDASKAHIELGWKPLLKIDPALEWLVSWYRAWEHSENMQDYTLTQIVKYEQMMKDSHP
jgi:CDP-glucose 4,6-dehydratase